MGPDEAAGAAEATTVAALGSVRARFESEECATKTKVGCAKASRDPDGGQHGALMPIVATAIAPGPALHAARSRMELEMGVSVGILGFTIPLDTWLKNQWIVNATGLFAALTCIIYALAIDFSLYFPSRLKMDVYFDKKGLSRTLRLFSAAELLEIAPSPNWEQGIEGYDASVLEGLRMLWAARGSDDAPPMVEINRDSVHAQGEAKLCVSRSGWLLYKISEGSGILHIGLDIRNRNTFRFRSEFYLRESSDNYIRPRPLDLLRSPTVVLRPEFKQVFQIERGGPDAPFDHVVIGLTKLRLLPTPSFTDTIYLCRTANGETVPVAYAIYSSLGDKAETRGTSF